MNLQPFFAPRAVAVVGVSRDPRKVGHQVFASLQAYGGGRVYGLNTSGEEVLGQPTFVELSALPEVPELVVLCVSADQVPGCVRAAGRVGAKAAVVIASGFGERGEEGARLARELAAAGRIAEIEIVGPNSLGILDAHSGLNASLAGALPLRGEVAVLSQSGALCTGLLDMTSARQIGISKLISMGNKADLDETDYLEALAQDEHTRVIACYLEGIEDGARFIRRAARVARDKPIVVVKGGHTAGGARAASAHTGSAASSEQAYDCAFRIAGIIRAVGVEELIDLTQGLAWQPLPRGERVAVLTNAGGVATLGADAIEDLGLRLAVLSDETRAALRAELPPGAATTNPVDLLGDADAERYRLTLERVAADPGVDAIVVLHTPQAVEPTVGIARALVALEPGLDKPLLVSFLGAGAVAEAAQVMQEHRVPHYPSPERAARTLRVMADYRAWLASPERTIRRIAVNTNKVRKIIKNYRRRGLERVTEQDAKAVLEAYGIDIPSGVFAATAQQAVAAADKLGYPVVMKVVSHEVPDKGEVGGVRVDLLDAGQVEDAFDLMQLRIPRRVPGARVEGVLIEERLSPGREVILGMTRDPMFGPMLKFGLGGAYVEVLEDFTFHLAPLTLAEAMQMLSSTKTFALLEGVGGQQGVDVESIAACLQRIAQLGVDFPEIAELDINPLRVGQRRGDTIALDARIVLSPARKRQE
jgi:acetyl coenzyme A synthetase (ADP forming)-like protein